jgi:hypothetical protein
MNDMYNWQKSSYSGQGNTCLEVATNVPGTVAVRDGKNHAGPVLMFSADAWQAFVNGIKTGSVGSAKD